MTGLSIRTQRIIVLLAIFVASFALYVAAEGDSKNAEIVLLAILAALMAVTIRIG